MSSGEKQVSLSITKVRGTGGYKVRYGTRVSYALNSRRSSIRYDEDKAYYTDDPEDAVATLKDMAVEARRQGHTVQIKGIEPTASLVKRYSRSSEIGSLGNTTLFVTSDFSSTGFPLGVVDVQEAKRLGGRQ